MSDFNLWRFSSALLEKLPRIPAGLLFMVNVYKFICSNLRRLAYL